MQIKHAFGKALRLIRKYKKLTLLSFSNVSGRTYIGAIEKGDKSPTIEKIDELGQFLDIHPITMLYLTYVNDIDGESFDALSKRVKSEFTEIQNFKQEKLSIQK